jgi:plasmid stabilization system protein ParE
VANVQLLRRAEADLEEAVAWYESRSLRAARRFEREMTAALDRLAAMPEARALTATG